MRKPFWILIVVLALLPVAGVVTLGYLYSEQTGAHEALLGAPVFDDANRVLGESGSGH